MAKFESCFTIDVEDGVSIAMRDAFGKPVEQTDRVVSNTQGILDLLEKFSTKATFFILGQVAEDFPQLVKKIATAGHEIGVHGYNHLQFFRLNPDSAYDELRRAKEILEDLTGCEIRGHRAPAFSITPRTAWAIDVIAQVGFEYDSSIVPIDGRRFGWKGFPQDLVRITTERGHTLTEVPISTWPLLGRRLPFSGGSYLRLFPFGWTKFAFNANEDIRPNILYIHPYELDDRRYPEYYFRELKKASLTKQLKMRSYWLNRARTYPKLQHLLERHSFTTMWQTIENWRRETPEKKVHIDTDSATMTFV